MKWNVTKFRPHVNMLMMLCGIQSLFRPPFNHPLQTLLSLVSSRLLARFWLDLADCFVPALNSRKPGHQWVNSPLNPYAPHSPCAHASRFVLCNWRPKRIETGNGKWIEWNVPHNTPSKGSEVAEGEREQERGGGGVGEGAVEVRATFGQLCRAAAVDRKVTFPFPFPFPYP